mmetsp:Transcript_85388/g.169372  ORF Transcript_85388/g.169372 Transcript_85388/m.169372 type:complete len:479 (+) Transcript_85388:73-1509(+)
MGAVSCTACLVPMELMGTNGDDQLYREEFAAVLSDEVKNDVKMEVNERAKTIRVQAAEDIHYGSAGAVLKGATGIVHGKFTGNRNVFNFVNWDAFPELGRVSAQQEKLLPMFDDQPGTYVIMREAGVTETVELAKQVVCILPAGTTVKIVEVVHRLDQKRWRGRLEEPVKGWISLLASNNGARWVEKPSAGRRAGGRSGGSLKLVCNGAPPRQFATAGSFQVDASQQGMLYAMQPLGSERGRSPGRAGGSTHMVGSGQRSLSAPHAATVMYGSVYSSSRAGSVTPSQAGSFHFAAQAPILRGNSFQYTVAGEKYSTASSLPGSLQFPAGVAGQGSSIQYAGGLDRPASFVASAERRALSAVPSTVPSVVPHAARPMSMDEVSRRVAPSSLGPSSARLNQPVNSGKDKTSPEVLAVLQGIRQQLKGMADRYSDSDLIQGSDSNGNIPSAVHEQAVSSTEAPVKGASREDAELNCRAEFS